MKVLVLRPPQVPSNLHNKCIELCNTTKYQKYKKDCLTVIADLFEDMGWWQLHYIATMPQVLIAKHGFIIIEGMREGDLVFYTKNGLITHVSVAVSKKKVFHNSKEVGGCEIAKLKRLLSRCLPNSQTSMYSLVREQKDFYQIDPRTYNRGTIFATLFRQNITMARRSVFQLLLSQRRVSTVSGATLKSSTCPESPKKKRRVSYLT